MTGSQLDGVEKALPELPSRRSFLKFIAATGAAGAGLAASSLPVTGRAAEKAKKRVVMAAHPWVYAASLPGYDITPVLEQIFSDMSYAGLDAIELMHEALRHPDSVERIGELSHKYSLPVLGASFAAHLWDRSKYDANLEYAQTIITRIQKLGGRTLGTSVGAPAQKKTPEQLDAQAQILRKIIAFGESHGVVVNLHNHTDEVRDNEYDLAGTLARIPNAKLGPDLNWLLRAGVDPVDFIRRHRDNIVFMHLRDQKKDGTWAEAIGEGDTDFAAIGRELHKINFSGDAAIELAHEKGFRLTRPLRESLRMSREYVRGTMGY
jgi:sugar phosphate isomerase/epimerase